MGIILDNIKSIVIGVIVIAVLGFGGTFAWKYNALSKANEQLTENNQALAGANDLNNRTIAKMQEQNIVNEMAMTDLSGKLDVSEERSRYLSRLLQKHDLTELAKAKPVLIERRINSATQRIFDNLEELTK